MRDAIALWLGGFYGQTTTRTGFNALSLADEDQDTDIIKESNIDEEWACLSREECIYLMMEYDCLQVDGITDPSMLWKRFCLEALEREIEISFAFHHYQFVLFKSLTLNFTQFIETGQCGDDAWQLNREFLRLLVKNKFIVRYLTYSHFRKQHWIVRSGLKYSTDFLLYAKGPVFDHAKFGVDAFVKINGDQGKGAFKDWLHVIRKVRVVCQVKKLWKICMLSIDLPLDDSEVAQTLRQLYISPQSACGLYKITEKSIGRFQPEHHRSL